MWGPTTRIEIDVGRGVERNSCMIQTYKTFVRLTYGPTTCLRYFRKESLSFEELNLENMNWDLLYVYIF